MNITNPFLINNKIQNNQTKSVWSPRLIISLLFFTFVLISASASAQTLSASLERGTITFGESATLIIEISGSGSKGFQPDLSPLKKDFDIVNTGRSTQIQIINGKRTDKNQISITLMPHHYGEYSIPSIKVGSDQTRPLQLTVKDIPVVSSSKEGQSVWLEIETPLNKTNKKNKNNTDVMVQQEIPVTVKLFTALPLSNISISQPAPENAISEKVGDNIQYTVQHKGQNYHVIEQHYVIYPEQPGDLIIPPVVMRATTPDANQQRQRRPFGGDLFDDPFFKNAFGGHSQIQQMLKGSSMLFGNQGKSVSVRSDGLKLFVKHIPDEAKGTAWLPAQKVTLSSSWDNYPPNLKSGEPSSLILTIKAEGLTSANIPALHIADKKGSYRVYEEPVEMENLTDGQRVIGISRQKFTLIPERAGLLKLPAIKQAWWNTRTNQMQVAEIPAIDLPVIQGADFSTINSTSLPDNRQLPDDQHSSDAMAINQPHTVKQTMVKMIQAHWGQGGLLIVILLVLSLVIYRLKLSMQKAHTGISDNTVSKNLRETNNKQNLINKQHLKTSLQDAITACEAGHANLAARSILQWAKLVWPDIAPVSLLDVADNIKQGDKNMRHLHHYLYQPSIQEKTWSDTELATLLRKGLQRKASHNPISSRQDLPPLYPI